MGGGDNGCSVQVTYRLNFQFTRDDRLLQLNCSLFIVQLFNFTAPPVYSWARFLSRRQLRGAWGTSR